MYNSKKWCLIWSLKATLTGKTAELVDLLLLSNGCMRVPVIYI